MTTAKHDDVMRGGAISMPEVIRRLLDRQPAPPESTVTIGTTAKLGSAADPHPQRIHTWDITVRGEDPIECARLAELLDWQLSVKYAHELTTLTDELERSVKANAR